MCALRSAEFVIAFNKGIDMNANLLEACEMLGIVTAKGSHYYYKEQRLGHGREAVSSTLAGGWGAATLPFPVRDVEVHHVSEQPPPLPQVPGHSLAAHLHLALSLCSQPHTAKQSNKGIQIARLPSHEWLHCEESTQVLCGCTMC